MNTPNGTVMMTTTNNNNNTTMSMERTSCNTNTGNTNPSHHRPTFSHRRCWIGQQQPQQYSIKPSIEGIQQVATKLATGHVVAIPTECTYEVAIQLHGMSDPTEWIEQIRTLQMFVQEGRDSLSTLRDSTAVVDAQSHEPEQYCQERDSRYMVLSSCQGEVGEADVVADHKVLRTKVPTVTSSSSSSFSSTLSGVNDAVVRPNDCFQSVDSYHVNAGTVECSNTNCSRVDPCSSTATRDVPQASNTSLSVPIRTHRWTQPLVPHIYVHKFACLDTPFWRKYLPKRPYAVRNKQGEILAAHAFNEQAQLIRLLAARVWPGPVVLYTAIGDPIEGFTVERDGRHYLALRSLCHPLMVKVYQEYVNTLRVMTDIEDEDQNLQVDAMNIPTVLSSPDPKSVMRNHPWTNTYIPTQFLIGLPLPHRCNVAPTAAPNSANDSSTYAAEESFVTRAVDVDPGLWVLNGEEPHDIFSVPPCVYGRPSTDAIWLDASRRLVIVSGKHWTVTQLQQALRKKTMKPMDKDRVISAVMAKWKVIEDDDDRCNP